MFQVDKDYLSSKVLPILNYASKNTLLKNKLHKQRHRLNSLIKNILKLKAKGETLKKTFVLVKIMKLFKQQKCLDKVNI